VQTWLTTWSPSQVTFTVPQLSDALPPVKSWAGTAAEQFTETAAGAVIDGAVSSFTVMVCEHVEEFPHASVARYVLVNVNLFVQL
jgi:hypothetical protein